MRRSCRLGMINQSSSSGNDDNNQPLKFVDTIDKGSNKHIVLFYEDPEYARMIEFQFVKNGLLKEEHCIITTFEDNIQIIKNEMEANNIDVEALKKNLLHIYQIPDPMNHPEGELKGMEEIRDRIFADSKPPYRIVSRAPEIKTKQQAESDIIIQHTVHFTFGNFPGSVMCSYQVDKIEPKIHGQWFVNILQNHHAAIFAPKSGQGIAFDMR
jgi:hypothetical protein